jgi:hypothetical protein
MKNYNLLIGLILCFSVNNIFASSSGSCSDNEIRFNYAVVSGPPVSTPVLVIANGTIFNLTVSGSLKNSGDWDSTSVEIVGFSPICFSNTGSSVSGSAWTERINTFSLTAPSVTGIYDMLITMNKDSSCNGCNKQKTITFGVGTLTAGPQGPQGPTGPSGEPGQDGEDGQNGADGTNGVDGTDGQNGTSCTIVENEDGSATITCGEESVTIQPGQNGLPGENGSPGLDCFDLNANGRGDLCDPEALFEFGDCLSFQEYCQSGGNEEDLNVTNTNAKLIRASKQIFDCTFTEDINGNGVVDILDCQGQRGQAGNPGLNGNGGVTGATGAPGSSCSVKDNQDGTYTMSCTDGSYVTWHDGQDGIDGQNGLDGMPGTDGQPGSPGLDGVPCVSTPNNDGTTTITCGNNSFLLGSVTTADVASVPPPQGGICGSIDIITLLAGLAIGSGAGFVRKQ